MIQVRCNGCREWFDNHISVCPGCGVARPGYNKSLYTAKMNDHLYGLANSADREAKYERQLKSRS